MENLQKQCQKYNKGSAYFIMETLPGVFFNQPALCLLRLILVLIFYSDVLYACNLLR